MCCRQSVRRAGIRPEPADATTFRVETRPRQPLESFPPPPSSHPNYSTRIPLCMTDDTRPALRDLYESAWGREWQPLSKFQVRATVAVSRPGHPEPKRTTSNDNDDDSIVHISASVDPGIPDTQDYVCYGGLHKVALALGLSREEYGEVLVVRSEYDLLIERLAEGDLKKCRRLVVTGHPGIGMICLISPEQCAEGFLSQVKRCSCSTSYYSAWSTNFRRQFRWYLTSMSSLTRKATRSCNVRRL